MVLIQIYEWKEHVFYKKNYDTYKITSNILVVIIWIYLCEKNKLMKKKIKFTIQ
jgi:hypothetical protein